MDAEPKADTQLSPDDVEKLIIGRGGPFMVGPGKRGNEIIFWISPAGAQKGDTYTGSHGSGYTFTGPEGEVRGVAEMHILPRKEGRMVQRKLWEHARAQGVDKSGSISYRLRIVRTWLEDNLRGF